VFIDYNWDGDNTTIRYGQDGFDAIEHIRFLVKNDYPYSTFAEFIEPKITALGERMERIETLLSELKENHN
jgi:hypothetical protein